MDFSSYTTSQIKNIVNLAHMEISLRDTIEHTEERIVWMTQDYAAAINRQPGDAWTEPTGAHDAYQQGDQVTHDEVLRTSRVNNNVWHPTNEDKWGTGE